MPTLRDFFAEIRREKARQGIMMGKTPRNSKSERSALATRNLDEGRRSDKVPQCDHYSGAADHMTGESTLLSSYSSCAGKMIGSAKESGGLYHLDIGSTSQPPSKTISSCFEYFSVLNDKDDNIMV
ncbi:hypothetical protein KIW84_053086 [Lathyrus oleraceus]|uniref:Uncharacterized protein n=1 Tax=Pisum sativum TaxID=3888 RepID=A0A9D4WRW7_PEA|nr:hypothetical protein KIW84_053086 [Pisum sativum]